MFDRVKRCSISDGVMIRLNNFLIVFNLRQGTILVAVHQIALSSFMLIIMLVGMSHAGEMMMMLHNDMEDDAERRGFYDVTFGDQLLFHEGDVVSTNNQRRFAKAQSLASMTVILLYTATIFTAVYLFCCILLLHGAVRCARAYMLPWLCAASVAAVLLCALAVAGDSYPCVVELFGGHRVYHLVCALIVLSFIYAILAVGSYAFELGRLRRTDERGERLLLLHHASHCSLLSAAQLSKLSAQGTRSQFV